MAVSQRIAVGQHPTAAAWDEAGGRLYVANGNSDRVSVVDTRGDSLLGEIAIAPFAADRIGLAPTALALSPDRRTLYLALGGVNAVAIYDLPPSGAGATLRGLLPTSWYPTTIDVSRDGRQIAVGSLLGVGSGTGDAKGGQSRPDRYVHAVRGAVSVIDIPRGGTLAAFTVAVAENNRLRLARDGTPALTARSRVAPRAVPERPGEASLIKHVVYIIKENRTFDQVLGDLGRGDGDSSLVLYGRDVTPNAHALAEQYVTFDRFFASGGNSADGHQWLTQANETEYTLWPLYGGRSYPFDGTDPLAYSSGGFIWESAEAKGKQVAVFGEYTRELSDAGAVLRSKLLSEHQRREAGEAVPLPSFTTRSEIPSLDRALVRDFPGYGLGVPDVVRAEIFLAHLQQWQRADSMPALVMIQLPSNHTAGATADWCTPKACVADNDLALGRIVEALSHSPFWHEMAIFVVEDDAQNGVDHVDGHRTVALAVSPFARRGWLDHTFYNHPSILKTIELMLGLPSLSLFDLVATDMGPSFVGPDASPEVTPFTAIVPGQSIHAVNPRPGAVRGEQRRAALESARMNFSVPDAAPSDRLNRILWRDARGWGSVMPAVRRALFFPMSLDVADDDR